VRSDALCTHTKRERGSDALCARAVADMMKSGVMIGKSNRAVKGYNNVLLFAPALVATKEDIDVIVDTVDLVLGRLARV